MSYLSITIPALPVEDIARAVDFYRDRFGLAVRYVEDGFAIGRRDEGEGHWERDVGNRRTPS